jgi:uncharacterized protein
MFREILVKLMNDVKGARWAIVAGGDGVPVDASSEASVSTETLAAEYAFFVRACQRVLAETGGDELRGFELLTNRGKVILEPLTPEYFLLMGLEPEGYTGQARFEILRARSLMEQELVV